MPANYITREGLGKLKNELEELKTTKRQEIAEKLQRSIAFGDLSENAEYQEAKEEQAFLEGRISELEDAVESAIIIDTNSNSHGVRVVSLGSKVVIERTKADASSVLAASVGRLSGAEVFTTLTLALIPSGSVAGGASRNSPYLSLLGVG